MVTLPADEDSFYRWILILMVVHLVTAYGIHVVRNKKFPDWRGEVMTRVFDSATFASSVMLIAGIVQPKILLLIGSTKPFLLVAGVAGVLYGVHALIKEWSQGAPPA
jgi:hypothetical protein